MNQMNKRSFEIIIEGTQNIEAEEQAWILTGVVRAESESPNSSKLEHSIHILHIHG
jgi:hypothetical protein